MRAKAKRLALSVASMTLSSCLVWNYMDNGNLAIYLMSVGLMTASAFVMVSALDAFLGTEEE